MKFWKKTKGAVSIFLVLILVPMLTVSSLFVDASRIKLAKAVAESAGALTLNTALTNYDTELKELYGLIATAQDTSDLFGKLEDYYKTCITSSGVSDEDAETYVEQIMASLGVVSESDNTADIMNMEVVDFAVQKYADGNLANATVLEKQIVEFMKYRAPINTGLSFVNALQSFSTLSKQTELVEKKQEYYETQQTVMEKLKAAWGEIAKYNGTEVGSDGVIYLNTIETDIKKYAGEIDTTSYNDYKTLHKWMVMDVYQVKDRIDYDWKVGNREEKYTDINGKEKTQENVLTVTQTTKNGAVIYDTFADYCKNYSKETLPTADDIKVVISNFYKAKGLADGYDEELDRDDIPGNAYAVQVIAQKYSTLNQYTTQMVDLYNSYHKMQAMMIWVEAYKNVTKKDSNDKKITPESIKQTEVKVDKTTKDIAAWYADMKKVYEDEMKTFGLITDEFGAYSATAKPIYEEHSKAIEKDVAIIASSINAHVEELKEAKGYLEEAIKKLEEAKTLLTGDVATAKTAWNTVADDESIKNTSLAQQDQAEIDQLDQYLNTENIDKLIKRLTPLKGKLGEVIGQLEGYKYGGKFIGDINSLSVMEEAIKSVCKDTELKHVPLETSQLEAKANSWWPSCWESGGYKDDWVKESNCKPNLNEDKPALYNYLSTNFQGSTASETKTEDKSNGENYYKKIKENGEKKASSKSSGTDSGQTGTDLTKKKISGDSLPSKANKDNTKTPSGSVSTKIDKNESTDKDGNKTTEKGAAGKSASSLGKLFGTNFLNAVAGLGEDLRDKLYVADYVMSMFSYDTIEAEYLKEHEDDGVTEIKDGMLLSLTKNDISAKNNYVYGAEVEYIIYGGGNTGNLTKAYGSIYGIRFGFNLIYAFATSEIRDSAFAIATPISAATLGVIPVPLIQAVIIIGLACCESALDLVNLKGGEAIPLYKSSKTWTCSITGLTNMVTEEAAEIMKDGAEALVDEGVNQINKLLDLSEEELAKLTDKGADTIANTVTHAYDQIITENAEVAIQQLTTLVNTAVESTKCLDVGETYETKKTEMKKWVKENLQTWGNQFTGSDLASMVKREAVNIIVNNSDTLINGLFEAVEKSGVADISGMFSNGASPGDGSVDELGGTIMEQIAIIRRKIQNTINEGGNQVKTFITQQVDKVKDSVNEGAESLKKTLNEQIDGLIGTGENQGGTGMASLCSFTYSDYLRLFVLIGLYTNQEKVVLRIGDVIQTNMAKCAGQGDGYKLSNSAAYVEISAKIQVKPTLLALPIFADVHKNPLDNANWYTIDYSSIAGY